VSSEPRDQYLAVCDELQRVVAERDALRALLRQVDKKSCAQLSEWYEFIDEIKDALAGKDAL